MSLLKPALGIASAGVLVALAANALSPRGVSLTRDYFPSTAAAPVVKSAPGQQRAEIRSKRGFPLATHEQVLAWFRDPAFREQRIIFIDARGDDAYATSHIEGAYQFDHYRPERHLANVLALSQLAERIVVYCTGGECEDSELAVQDLQAVGVPADKLVIYGGGITEWTKHGLPTQGAKK